MSKGENKKNFKIYHNLNIPDFDAIFRNIYLIYKISNLPENLSLLIYDFVNLKE